MKNYVKGLAIASAALVSSASHAVSVIDAGVTAQVADTTSDITTVGGLIIGLSALSLGIRWVKATFF